jgi:hypothetical protein
VVRAPITGAVLVTEMAGNLTHFPAFILVSVVAILVAGAARTRPIYDLLLEQVAPAPQAEKGDRPETTNSCKIGWLSPQTIKKGYPKAAALSRKSDEPTGSSPSHRKGCPKAALSV